MLKKIDVYLFCDDRHKDDCCRSATFVSIKNDMSKTNQNVAEQFIQYLNEENFEKAESCLDPDFTFIGVLGTREGASIYMQEMKQMKLKYHIIKTFTAGEDVCIWYTIDMGQKAIEASGWYQITDGKIDSFKVLFDPRPLLNDQ